MFNWLKKLFSNSQRDKNIELSARAVLVFMRSVKTQVNQRDFMIPNHHTLFYCYAYGAIVVETTKYELNESERYAALLLLFPNLSEMSADEISGLMNRCLNTLSDEEGQRYQQEGSDHYRRWNDADPSVTGLLGRLFEQREKDLSKVNRAIIYP